MWENSEIQTRIELMTSGGRGYNPIKPKLAIMNCPEALNITLGFMETDYRMAQGNGVIWRGNIPSYTNRRMDLLEIPKDVRDYIAWENRELEKAARRDIVDKYIAA